MVPNAVAAGSGLKEALPAIDSFVPRIRRTLWARSEDDDDWDDDGDMGEADDADDSEPTISCPYCHKTIYEDAAMPALRTVHLKEHGGGPQRCG